MEKNSIKIWNPSGCLSREAIAAWQQKTLSQADKYLIEQHIEECPLCKDALEGYSMLSPEKLSQSLEFIDRSFDKSFNKEEKKKPISRKLIYSLVAAVILAFVGVFTVYKYTSLNKTESSPIAQEIGNKSEIKPASEQSASQAIGENAPPATKILAQKTETKIAKNTDDVILEAVEKKSVSAMKTYDEAVVSEAEPPAPQKQEEVSEAPRESEAVVNASKPSVMAKRTTASASYAKETAVSLSKADQAETAFYVAEEPALFKGGDISKFKEYVEEKLKSSIDKNNTLTGDITVNFTVDRNGNVKDVFIVKGIDSKIDSIVLKVIKNSPNWTPAKQGGKTVNMNMVLPLKITSK